jgi:hypothetical protein
VPARDRLALGLVSTATLLIGCTHEPPDQRRVETLLPPAPSAAPATSLPLPVVRAPACLGKPTPTPTPQYARFHVDFVQFGGRTYFLAEPQPTAVAAGRRLGAVLCTYDDGYAPVAHVTVDGDASRLPVGTPLLSTRAVAGAEALVAEVPRGRLLYVLDRGG